MNFINKKNFAVTGLIWIFLVSGCGFFSYETKTVETVRGRLKYVVTLEFRNAGTHGGKNWVAKDRQFYVDGQKWFLQPNFDDCEASPNEAVEAFKCFYIKDMRTSEFLVRMKGASAEQKSIFLADVRNDETGVWANIEDGTKLVYKDFIYNVLTDEKNELKGLPDYPEDHFRAIAPDLQTIIYEGACFYGFHDAPPEIERMRTKVCEESKDDAARKLVTFWLIDVRTGESKIIKVSREKYDWLLWDREKFPRRNDWLRLFQQNLSWEKDKQGRDRMISPKPL